MTDKRYKCKMCDYIYDFGWHYNEVFDHVSKCHLHQFKLVVDVLTTMTEEYTGRRLGEL